MSSINTANVTTFQYAQRLVPDAAETRPIPTTGTNWFTTAVQTVADMFAQFPPSDIAMLGDLLINGRAAAVATDGEMRSE